MTLFKRHFGRRVAGVGLGAALLVLGLEAPAFALAPTVASFSPGSGPEGCVVVVTGTNFQSPTVTDVTFLGGAAVGDDKVADFHIISGTELWTTVPAAAANGPIQVTNPTGSGSSTSFTVTGVAGGSPGGCAPTFTSFTPTCGDVGTTVTITGTNLLMSSGDDKPTATAPAGGDVAFAPYSGNATPTGAAVTPTTLTVLVSPSTATDGPIRVTTQVDADTTTAGVQGVFSATDFLVPPPPCAPVGPTEHARSVTLSLRKHLVARGKVSVGDGFTDCAAAVPVKIQRRVSGAWRTVGSTTTTDTGAYKKRIKDKTGKYRARAPMVSLGTPVTDTCSVATSPVRRHTH